jgi:hypothetical protein
MDIHKIINGLSQAQKGCLKYAKYSRAAEDYFVEVDDCTRAATIKALKKKKLLWGTHYHFWFTDAGEAVRKELNAL